MKLKRRLSVRDLQMACAWFTQAKESVQRGNQGAARLAVEFGLDCLTVMPLELWLSEDTCEIGE